MFTHRNDEDDEGHELVAKPPLPSCGGRELVSGGVLLMQKTVMRRKFRAAVYSVWMVCTLQERLYLRRKFKAVLDELVLKAGEEPPTEDETTLRSGLKKLADAIEKVRHGELLHYHHDDEALKSGMKKLASAVEKVRHSSVSLVDKVKDKQQHGDWGLGKDFVEHLRWNGAEMAKTDMG